MKYDRATFVAELDQIRRFRNVIMHFGDPMSPADLDRIRAFADMVRIACAAASKRPPKARGE